MNVWGMCMSLLLSVLPPLPLDADHGGHEKGREYFEARGEVIWDVPNDRRAIALTFDDGPNPVYTPQIIQLLDEYQAKATFFVVGSRVKKYPQVAHQLVRHGHEIANHTYSHPNMRKLTSDSIQHEIETANAAIHTITGATPRLFRPPGGYYDETVVSAAREAGYLVVMWSWHQDTRDWSNPGVKKIVNKVLSNVRNGDIILFHDDGGNRTQTILALKEILPELKRREYQFVTVSELIRMRAKQPVHKKSSR